MGILDRIKRTHENIMQGRPFQWIPNLFFGILKYASVLIFFIFLFFTISILFNATAKGETQVLATRLENTIENTKILQPIYSTYKEALKIREDPTRIERAYGWKTNVDTNKENQELGLRFVRNLRTLKERFLTGEEVVATTTVEVSSLKEDSTVTFFCNITKDFPPDKTIIVQPNEPQKLFKDQRKRFEVACRIPGDTFTIPNDKEVLAKKLRLSAAYDFETDSYLDVYTMQQSYLDSLINNGINPFENEINSNLNKATGQTTPTTTYGPMKVILRLEFSQPLTEKGPFSSDNTYSLGLKIEKTSSSWFGRLRKINNVYINLPGNFELVDENFIESSDFKETSFEDTATFKRYKLKQEKIDELDNQCSIYRMSPEECEDVFDKGFIIIGLTKFRISNPEQQLVKDYIGAQVDYEYQSEIQTTFTLVKSLI